MKDIRKPYESRRGLGGTLNLKFRLLAIKQDGTLIIQDFGLLEEQNAILAVHNEKYRSAALFDNNKELVAGKMAQADIQSFQKSFMSN